MSETDLSDEAAMTWWKCQCLENKHPVGGYMSGWQESRRRAQIQIEKERREAWLAYWDYLFQPGEKNLAQAKDGLIEALEENAKLRAESERLRRLLGEWLFYPETGELKKRTREALK